MLCSFSHPSISLLYRSGWQGSTCILFGERAISRHAFHDFESIGVSGFARPFMLPVRHLLTQYVFNKILNLIIRIME